MFLMERVFIDKVAELLIQIESAFANNGECIPPQVFTLLEISKDVIECQRNSTKD
jgi:hypothetical protein